MRLNVASLGSVTTTDTYRSSIGWPSFFQPTDGGVVFYRIARGDPERSSIVYRARIRDSALMIQMPPLATHIVDDAAIQLLETWVRSL